MSKPVVVFDDQEIANSEPSTPFVTDRRCWSPVTRYGGRSGEPYMGACGGRLAYNSPADALLCPECGSVYNFRLELLGTSTSWDGEIDTGAGDYDTDQEPAPRRRIRRTPLVEPVFETMLDSLIRTQRESEMYGAEERGG